MTGYQYRPKPIKAGHQKKTKKSDKLTKLERQRKKEKKTKYIVIRKIAKEKYKKLLTLV